MIVAGGVDHYRFAGAGAAAFPQVLEVLSQPFTTATSHIHNVAMPASVAVGQLLLLFFTWRANADHICDVPVGWTALYNSNVSLAAGGACFAKDALGTEGGTVVNCVTRLNGGGVSGRVGTAITYLITDWFGTLGTGVVGATANVGSTSTPNPPSLTPSWGAANNLWIAHVHAVEDDATVSSAPTDYTNLIAQITGNGINASCTSGSARRFLNAASEDPGAFTLSEAETCHTGTVAVRPV